MTGITGPSGNLRIHLRAATAAAHDLLDAAMRSASGWTVRSDYARFLSLQYAARGPVEAWLEHSAPPHLRPPSQTPLIARDLADLGLAVPAMAAQFSLPSGRSKATDGEALGAAWVLAGSALGNRSILKEVKRAGMDDELGEWPRAFLSDGAMLAFWQDLRSLIECPTPIGEAEAASEAAAAVFGHFITHVEGGAQNVTAPRSFA